MSAVQSQAKPADAEAGAINVDDDVPFDPFEEQAQDFEVAQVKARHERSVRRAMAHEWQ